MLKALTTNITLAGWFLIAVILLPAASAVAAISYPQTIQPPPPKPIDTLVICPKAFQAELQRWVDYRAEQGHQIQVQEPGRSAMLVQQQILDTARFNDLKHIVLVGDSGDQATRADVKVPTSYVERRDTSMPFSSAIATDNQFADLNRDGTPDVSIGRIPIDSAQELKLYIDRVIAYEKNGLPIASLRRVNFVAGVGGFSKLIDSVIEETTKQIITDLVPGGIETTMTYGSWSSPYCPDPRRFSENAISRFNEGCLFWVYIGHGAHRYLDNIYVPGAAYPILGPQNADKVNSTNGAPIAIFLACNTTATDPKFDGLAETLLKQSGGPIATIGGSRVTKPAAMALLSLSMMHEYFHAATPTLGEMFLKAKRDMIHGSTSYQDYRKMIEGLAITFSPKGTFKNERLDHAHLLHLLGDPLLRLPRPEPIVFGTNQKNATAGESILITGKSPEAGKLTFELAYRRDRLKKRFKRRLKFDPANEALEKFEQTYDDARNLVCQSISLQTTAGMFATKLRIPDGINGDFVIRAKLESGQKLGIGSIPIRIAKQAESRAEAPQKPILR